MFEPKFSKCSSDHITELFAALFPDCSISKFDVLSEPSEIYGTSWTCFPRCLPNEFKTSPFHVISNDENFNRELYIGQIYFSIQLWDESKKVVDTRYVISEFLQGANAEQLVWNAEATLDQLNLIQISSDGSNVDLKVLKIIADQREEGNRLPVICIGTCGLHTADRIVQNEVVFSGWKIAFIFKCI